MHQSRIVIQPQSASGSLELSKQMLGWEPATSFDKGLTSTYEWITEQYLKRKAGQRVVE